jgi:hypothetical protein
MDMTKVWTAQRGWVNLRAIVDCRTRELDAGRALPTEEMMARLDTPRAIEGWLLAFRRPSPC